MSLTDGIILAVLGFLLFLWGVWNLGRPNNKYYNHDLIVTLGGLAVFIISCAIVTSRISDSQEQKVPIPTEQMIRKLRAGEAVSMQEYLANIPDGINIRNIGTIARDLGISEEDVRQAILTDNLLVIAKKPATQPVVPLEK